METRQEIDQHFRWRLGTAERLARRGRLPHVILPDGETIRFNGAEIEGLVKHVAGRSEGASK